MVSFKEIIAFMLRLGRWFCLLVPLALFVGSFCALFLWMLEWVTHYRFTHPNILYGLPLAGVAVALSYYWWGGRAGGGNNLILDEINKPGEGVPLRMAPLVFIGTVVSHLFGASVGREGTAVQMGGSLASNFARLFCLDERETRILLMAGMASGLGAVYGTPITGAVFGLEVVTLGALDYSALLPVAVTSIIADWTCHQWGIHHASYIVSFKGFAAQGQPAFHVDALLWAKVALAAVAFGFASKAFSEGVYRLAPLIKKLCPQTWLQPAIGGVATIALVWLLGTRDYLGLGVTAPELGGASIVNFFGSTHYAWSWLLKLLFTVIALATGYKGGEVTPLFFIGAGLGNALAPFLGVPGDLLAGVGMVAVFGGAVNAPLACTIMGVELFGGTNIVYYATGCFIAYLCSGHTGIYLSQRVGIPKIWRADFQPGILLKRARNGVWREED
ncbi:voltage-gated chloride channel family protein [Bombella pollinis]|uniref:Voltage-gated chloride channel family protein n=1 Tax=Bombella pollinis TaxID=2967337 RepID=A0ABT3WJS1_9PROT|nr:voltage-gated chloride channel family protein [Bombella pollinis]MCX5619362.1 voltage-gated chloride channel family protein [Bombella pollinis]